MRRPEWERAEKKPVEEAKKLPRNAKARSRSPAPSPAQDHLGNQEIQQLFHAGAIQAKLRVSQPGDADEIEADRVAEQVTSAPNAQSRGPEPSHPGTTASASLLRRKCGCSGGASCPECEQEQGGIHRSAASAPAPVRSAPDPVVQSLGPGHPLDPSVRKTMEGSLGRSFASVRVHSGPEAATSAAAVDARAFTYGDNIVFNTGQYSPASPSGKKLIAHELVHVAQNENAGPTGSPRSEIKRESLVGEATSYLSGKKEAAGKWIDAKKWDIYRAMIVGMKAGKNAAIGQLRALVPKLSPSLRGAASAIIDALDLFVDIVNALLLAIIGLAVGFVTGIVDLIVGLIKLVLGLIKLVVDALVALLGQPDEFNQDLNDLAAAIRGIPPGLKKVVDEWLERYKHSTLEEQVLMGGELVGQIEAFIATFALAGTKAGQATSLTVRTGSAGVRAVAVRGGVAALKEVPATVTVAIPAVVPKTAAEAAVITSQAMMMSGPGQSGGSGGGSSSGKGSSTPKGPEGEGSQEAKSAAKADAEEARLQKKYGGRSKTAYPASEWKYIEQLEERYPKLKSARLRPTKRPVTGDEAIFEERMQTGQGRFSLAAYNDKGEQIIQFDGISANGFVEEVKIEQSIEKVDEIVTQLRRQADFARDYGLKGVEYSISPPKVAAEVESRVVAERLRNVYRTGGN